MCQSNVKELADGGTRLTDAAKQELQQRMAAAYPNAGLTFLIAMGADPIAAELNAKR